MAEILERDPESYERERHGFLRELKQFHDSRGTSYRQITSLNNEEIDLYLLYVLVTSRGGWQRVNSRDEWDELLPNFNIGHNVANGSLALKQIYLRYLDHYEKIHFHGEDPQDQADQDDSNTGHRKKVVNPLHNVPLNYNHNQHTVSETTRNSMGLSTNLYQSTEYDRLGLSLISPLPNEQDFGINVCTLLANEGRHTLKLDKYPRLLDYLLFHAGCFSHRNLRQLHDEYWLEAGKYNLVRFWEDLIYDENVREVLLKEDVCKFEMLDGSEEDLPPFGVEDEISCTTCALNQRCLKPKCKITPADRELFNVQRTLEVRDREAQRALQIANILRNASFEEGNATIMGRNRTCLRFLLLCIHCGCGALPQLGLDTLGNIAAELTIHNPRCDRLSAVLLKTLTSSLSSPDRSKLIGSLECLNKLAQKQSNEDILSNALETEVYEAVSLYLSVSDIVLLIHTLECLYSLSSLGEKACVALTHATGALATLVSLLTVEAQSYGPKACILMKVIETAPAITSGQARVGSQNTFTEAELFAMTWLRSNCDVDATSSLEQGELYRRYVRVVTTLNKVGALTVQQFSNCVRVVFGGHVGPIQKTSKAGVLEYHYDGIKSKLTQPSQTATPVRPSGTTVISNQTPVQSVNSTSNALPAPLQPTMTSVERGSASPILKATLSNSAPTQVNQSIKAPIVQPNIIQKQAPRPPQTTPTPQQTTPTPQVQIRHQTPVKSLNPQMQCTQSIPIEVKIKTFNTQQQIVIPHDQLQNLMGTIRAQLQMADPQASLNFGVLNQDSSPIKQQSQPILQQSQQQQMPLQQSQQQQVSIQQTQQQQVSLQQPQQQQVSLQQTQQQQVSLQQTQQQSSLQQAQHQLSLQQTQQQQVSLQQTQLQQTLQHTQQVQPQQAPSLQNQISSLKQPLQQQSQQQLQQKQLHQQLLQQQEQQLSLKQEVINFPNGVSSHGDSPSPHLLQNGDIADSPQSMEDGKPPVKGILAEMLEKRIGKEAPVNGMIDKEIRISEKGLQMVMNRATKEEDVDSTVIIGNCDEKSKKRTADNEDEEARGVKKMKSNDCLSSSPKDDGKVDLLASLVSSILEEPDEEEPKLMPETIATPKVEAASNANNITSSLQQRSQQIVLNAQNRTNASVLPQMVVSQSSVCPIVVSQPSVVMPTAGGSVVVPQSSRSVAVPSQQASGPIVVSQQPSGQVVMPQTPVMLSQPSVVMSGGSVVMSQSPSVGSVMVSQSSSTRSSQQTSSSVMGQVVMSSSNPSIQSQGSLIQVPSTGGQPRIVMGTSQGQLMLTPPSSTTPQGQFIVVNQNGAQYIVAPQQSQAAAPSTVQARLLLTPGSTTGQLVIDGNAAQPAASTPPQQQQPPQQPSQPPPPTVSSTVNQQQGKAFIIVHPQQGQKVLYQVPQPQKTTTTASPVVSSPVVVTTAVSTSSTVVVTSSGPNRTSASIIKQPVQTYVNKNKVKLPVRTVPSTAANTTQPKASPKDIYICDWAGCNLSLGSARSVYMHACETHCPEYLDEIPCLWERCDQMPRRRFSLMTHLLDRHCNEQVLVVMAARRQQLQAAGKAELQDPAPPPPHPGYAHNAAYQAIRRHALESSVMKDLGEEKEGPVTKSIRLTSSLIIRNMCIYSSQARRLLRSYESHLTSIALSSVESSRTVSQILYDLSHDES